MFKLPAVMPMLTPNFKDEATRMCNALPLSVYIILTP